jgi:cystathionine beta-lyase family protein involved in aluminum resistance
MAAKHRWTFRSRFRANAFGWRSDLPIKRIKEAVSEIRKVNRKDAVLAADGAVLLLEKRSPSLMQVDSSSGALGAAVNNAIAALVPIIAQAPADDVTRDQWLEWLWQAVEDTLYRIACGILG